MQHPTRHLGEPLAQGVLFMPDILTSATHAKIMPLLQHKSLMLFIYS